jgi:penicillin-binding protein 1C
MRIPRARWFLTVAVIALALPATAGLGVAFAILWPARVPSFTAVRAAYVPSDAWLLDRHGAVIDSRRVRMDVRRLAWVPLDDVSPALVAAIVAGEDRRFYEHHGIDWESALGAVRDEAFAHRRRGASTITMQLASLLQPRRRTSDVDGLIDKLGQMRAARALEASWTKREILEAYLNLLGYHGELQGVGAAAARLAGKTPAGLSLPESLLLAALLPNPNASPERIIARACARSREGVLGSDCETLRTAAPALLAADRDVVGDHLAPQLAQTLLKTPGERVSTTLDANIQRLARDAVRSHLASLAEHNVRDGAALVVDNDSGEVLAYVASAGQASRAREVDGVQAPRQAGSTLKPFLYELALEQRYLTAASLLADTPLTVDTASGLYIPQDYDHDFKGLVSVRTALAGSLNVPAVRTLRLVGVESFRNRLHDLGYGYVREDGEYYGYSLALGSAEVSLWQEAAAYRTLARGGLSSPITLTHARTESVRLLPVDASFIVTDILGDPAARAVTFGLDNHLHTPFWTAVKTGTSEDMRDNWCVGFSRQFTVAVWVGNFEGDSMHTVSGVTGAAPVWYDLITALHGSLPSVAPDPPAGVSSLLTHFSPAVEPARREWYLEGAALTTRESAALPDQALPKIETPADGMVIALDPDIPVAHQRVLISVHGAGRDMQLKLNGYPLRSPGAPQFWTPHTGVYRLTLEDAAGRTLGAVHFTVRGSPSGDG